jgi:polyvinyl alcohol dehydrogenase (cytochrome)
MKKTKRTMVKMIQMKKRRLCSIKLIFDWTPSLLFVGILLALGYPLRTAFAAPEAETSIPLSQQWPMGGQNLTDTRYQAVETAIGPSNVSQLVVKWSFPTGGGVEASPAVVGGVVYFPDKGGNFYAVNATNGALVWSHRITDWTGLASDRSRGDPVIAGNMLFIGDQGGHYATFSNGTLRGPGARLIAVNRNTGAAVWVRQVEPFPAAVITSSPMVYNGVVYVGVSGGAEEDFAAKYPNYPCCSFRGSVVAVNELTGAILWKTYDMPSTPSNPGGYSGGAIWGSTPVIDTRHGAIYVGTGNNYWIPDNVQNCIATAQAMGEPDSVCDSVDNYGQDYFDSIIALDLNTGALKWGARIDGYDTWNAGCQLMIATCPDPKGTDSDFSAGPNLFRTVIKGNTVDVVGEGQKTGIYWTVNPLNGARRWHIKVGPGLSGRQWGTATDGQRIYMPFANKEHLTFTLQPSGAKANGGIWSALDPATGAFLWQTAAPSNCTLPNGTKVGCTVEGAASVANGVVYVGSIDTKASDPTMFALDAATGNILWSFASGAMVHSGPSIVGDTIYWGSGFVATKPGMMYALALPGS